MHAIATDPLVEFLSFFPSYPETKQLLLVALFDRPIFPQST